MAVLKSVSLILELGALFSYMCMHFKKFLSSPGVINQSFIYNIS